MDIQICLVTCPSKDVALALARLVVSERLAACVNIATGVQSVYQWKGEIAVDNEALLIIKTTRERVGELRERILENHPYEVPEFLAWAPELASDPYAKWIEQSVLG